MSDYILEMRNIVKCFPGVKALDKAGLTVRRGEIHALIGENGAGKSTLMNLLLGLFPQDEGEIIFKGQKVSFKSPREALEAGISMIHQELRLIPGMDVAENIWLGREKRFSKGGIINLKKRYRETEELLDGLGLAFSPRAEVRSLSPADMQLVELLRALSYRPDLIIMDEPTSSLTDKEARFLYRVIRDMAAGGAAIIFISHKLEELYEICHRLTVMRDGRFICERPIGEISMDELVKQVAGRTIKERYPKTEASFKNVALEVRDLRSAGNFQNISFTVRRGEILGICGLVGAGRTEIMRAIFGIDRFDSGEILVEGKKARIKSPKHAVALGLGMVTEDRRRGGIIANLAVRYNISLASLRLYCGLAGAVNRAKEREAADAMAEKLAVKAASMKQAIASLSGGNQQKAIIAKWLLAKPNVLILDEPTRGIDVGSKSEIHRLISSLAGEGMAVIMVSSELPEILGMSDRILTIRNGEITGEFLRGADHEKLIRSMFGI
ncbi:MAG: sugar ABC transporter ATP-binding protein [Treponema sp.]|jgi:ABC-type sugar transport system ATPase subunit|nr:sugar ABC transporter ATP-binding protein [Treponema sp.]